MEFKIEPFLNPNLAAGSRKATVVFSLTASGGKNAPAAGSTTARAIGFAVDTSGSMRERGKEDKLSAAIHGGRIAVNEVPDGVWFTVIDFQSEATVIVPIVQSSPESRKAASAALQRMTDGGGTYMSKALGQARKEFSKVPGAVCQLIFLTDGANATDDEHALDNELALCTGRLEAHCRGIGLQWSPQQLRKIAEKLGGTVGLIKNGDGLISDFRETMASAMSKSLSDVRLKLWMPGSTKLVGFEQSFPTKVDMRSKLSQVDERTYELSLGAWGEGTQDYKVKFDVEPHEPGEDPSLLVRPSIAYVDPATGQPAEVKGAPVRVSWTTDETSSVRMDPTVAHYEGESEKAAAIEEGLAALKRNDDAVATQRLGRALELAKESGDDENTRRLMRVVDVDDVGTVRVKRQPAGNDAGFAVMDLDVASTRTVRAGRPAGQA